MGTVFKKAYTKPMPADAEIVERKGQRVARWRDRRGKLCTAMVTTGEDGADRLLCETATYYGRYRDEAGLLVERSTGCRDEQAAQQTLRNWERDVERIKAGVITSAERKTGRHQATAIGEHVEAYMQAMEAAETTAKHRQETRRCVDRLLSECAISRLADLSREPLERWLVEQGRAGMGARTRNSYRNAVVSFAGWCVSTGRLMTNPLACLPKADEKAATRGDAVEP